MSSSIPSLFLALPLAARTGHRLSRESVSSSSVANCHFALIPLSVCRIISYPANGLPGDRESAAIVLIQALNFGVAAFMKSKLGESLAFVRQAFCMLLLHREGAISRRVGLWLGHLTGGDYVYFDFSERRRRNRREILPAIVTRKALSETKVA